MSATIKFPDMKFPPFPKNEICFIEDFRVERGPQRFFIALKSGKTAGYVTWISYEVVVKPEGDVVTHDELYEAFERTAHTGYNLVGIQVEEGTAPITSLIEPIVLRDENPYFERPWPRGRKNA